jgi:predicted ester cyclase
LKSFYAAFPDLTHEVQDLFSVEDRVVLRAVDTGTHQGKFMGLAPTGRSVEISVIAIFRFEDGRIAEIWEEADILGLLRQIGVEGLP